MELFFTILVGLVVLLACLHVYFPYFLHDCQNIWTGLRVRSQRLRFRRDNYTVLDCFLDRVKTQPAKTFIAFEGKTYSFLDVDRQSNRVARALKSHGCLSQGDTVALFLGNEPQFVWIWLGLAKIGCAAAMLNYNIRSKSLLQCFSCCKATVLIAGAELKGAVEEVLPTLREQNVSVFILGAECDTAGIETLGDKIERASDEPLSPDLRSKVRMESPAVYIYTSGTTGLPKAAMVPQFKIWGATFFLALAGVTSKDVIYINLPLYHSAGLMIGVAGAIERGITIVLRRKFSASQFWEDCRKYNVTVIQYIGEIMRYLCNSPKKDNDRDHKVRLAVGNGIRADVWKDFVNRFGSISIKEMYAATEGNMSFWNYVGKIGETGLLVSKITNLTPFVGYANNPEQTEKKRLRNVFQKGDLYFNSGDLLRFDRENFIYFQDRVGDTFRWKGENVATSEVADALTMLDFVEEANVYGVQVPGHEGRIGMAALILKEEKQLDCSSVFGHVANHLPAYGWPRFIRIQKSLQLTGTFKPIKSQLVREGFDPALIKDPLYFLDQRQMAYVLMTQEIYKSIISGTTKL
ncbi:hypothetical protein AAFF_G00428500 [Aldrovandia affinis]|uniref:long-chain-fatty-acid--CoA ligase n=1 Tax=Aldrovandia affinis TaxID=143900 RepID=A0AAD7WIV2_9TELE|nr:hypothetical protein AAFF_G00428500 [Aldrovandia affinis]